jgi:hypothetical protein
VAITCDPAKAEALKLIADGVNNSNQSKALETPLRLYVGGTPDDLKPIPRWLYVFALGATGLSIAFSFKPPAVVLGIGAGERRLRRWTTWFKVVFVTVPAFVFTNLLWPIVTNRFWPH